MRNLLELPADLPVPEDNGACAHLRGMMIPEISLDSTTGSPVNLAETPGRTVVYCYPRMGQPDQPIPKNWDAIPGARGCTTQSCSYYPVFPPDKSAEQTLQWLMESRPVR